MKRFSLLLSLIMLTFPGIAAAQDTNDTTYTLDQPIVVSTLDFTLAYPDGWVHDISNRIVVAENADDLAAIIDDDSSTQPAGYSLTLSSVPKSVIAEALSKDDPTLDEVAEFATSSIQIDRQFDLPILARRAASFMGINTSGRYGIGSIWEMDETYLIFGMGTAENEISDAFLALYEAVTATMKPFGDSPIELMEDGFANGDLNIPYPVDWTVEALETDSANGVGFFADAADIESWSSDGTTDAAAFQVLTVSTDQMADLSARGGADYLKSSLEETSIEGEFLIGGSIGFGMSGLDEDGSYVYYVAMTPNEDSWVIYSLTAGNQETGKAALPAFILMLQQISIAA